MNILLVILLVILIILYIKLYNEKRLGFIGNMSIIIVSFYNAILLIATTILIYLKSEVILNFILMVGIATISLGLIIYSLLSIYSSKRYIERKKYTLFEVFIIFICLISLIIMIVK